MAQPDERVAHAHLCKHFSLDLERLLEVLRIRGLKVVLMSTEGMVPRELRNAADRFVDLSSLKPQLEKTDGH